MKYPALKILSLLIASHTLSADVTLPHLFSDHMVLQRNLADPVWGKADPGETVSVTIAGQKHETVADADGKWGVTLDPMPAGGPLQMIIKGNNTIELENILVGEVWVCSGQSNMGFAVKSTYNNEVEIASANFPEIRLLSLPRKGTQEPQDDFEADWQICSPATVGGFSAVGYFFGRRIHETLGVPVGLIDNAWGGSAAEAWAPRELLEQHEQYADYISQWDKRAFEYTDEIHAEKMAEYKVAREEYDKNGGKRPRWPQDPRYGQHRPGNIYNGGVLPLVGYGIQGMIWYQGETNAGRPDNYEHLMGLVIGNMREQWGQGDFPFYWVQLADYGSESAEPTDSKWAHLREAQTKTMESVPNSGQAVIIDLGEGRDIHPRNKQTVADRLVRWPLAKEYGYTMDYRSPEFASMETVDIASTEEDGAETSTTGKGVLLSFDYNSSDGLIPFDTNEVKGFAIAGEDQQFHWAEAEIIGKNQVRVWSDAVAEPVAVRYAWATNPVANLYDKNGLPVTPFRTDDW
ncbi:sialate O-acetylesterase [Cerasicoccus arenae]|uniref:9-O-acetylesterase n=1 Tax=Cerasicoccus arenae TaxID=424488 RepID=A0A8J3GBZ3_9BACT|nr:sialate O-acetylesterase [Cerasicoccus arenae]MBK1858999.1 sialate O-acetylesterase [Cerasicoccus arenae]GHB94603.1 9-O-acetylesterase [Cerasicoccus arenae]